jgi:AhpD family alkylhydroperoxidase
MQQSVDFEKASAELALQLKRLLEQAGSGLPPTLIALVCLRVSQLNACERAVELHTVAARAAGETEARLAALSVWARSPLFTDRERAALLLSEAVTAALQSHLPQDAWKRLARQLTPEEIVDLTLLAAHSHVPEEIRTRLTSQFTQQQIDDLTVLTTVINTHSRCANTKGQAKQPLV